MRLRILDGRLQSSCAMRTPQNVAVPPSNARHSICIPFAPHSAVRFYVLLFHRSRDGFQYKIASNVAALLLMFGDSQGIP